MMKMGARAVLFCATFVLLGGAHAQVSEAEREALFDLYDATGGDEWIVNDGWLGEDGSECEWFGIHCSQEPDGTLTVSRIWLSGNNLSGGELDDSLEQLSALFELDLSGNQLQGSLPANLSTLPNLSVLDLSDNRYDDWPEDLTWPTLQQLNISRNQLSGAIPGNILTAETLRSNSTDWSFGGLDLCWNDLHAAGEQVESFVRERHRGIDFELCLEREFDVLDHRLSGSLFDPERSGEGITLMELTNGNLLMFSFTYDRDGNQRWRYGTADPGESSAVIEPFYETRGRFGLGHDPEGVEGGDLDRGNVEIDALAVGTLAILQSSREPGTIRPPVARIGFRLEYQPLTRLAGSTCENQQPYQWISGAWYDPERDGEGFIVEVIEDGRGVVYWFTYTPDGSGRQAWMMGDGQFDGTTLSVDNLIQPRGGIFGIDFDPELVDRVPWGSLTMTFDDDLNGHVWYDSVDEEYGNGDYPIERLARPMLAECE